MDISWDLPLKVFGAGIALIGFMGALFWSGLKFLAYIDKQVDKSMSSWKEGQGILSTTLRTEVDAIKQNLASIGDIKKEVGDLQEFTSKFKLEAVERTIALTSICLYHLPHLTYTQQIPPSSTMLFKFLGSATLTADGYEPSRGNPPRHIHRSDLYEVTMRQMYCRALYKFSSAPLDEQSIVGEENESVLNLLNSCLAVASQDPILTRDIILRKAQALRQSGRFEQAHEELNRLAQHKIIAMDPASGMLVKWARAVLQMQQGLQHTDKGHRAQRFAEASTLMKDCFKSLYGWRCEGAKGRSSSTICDGSVAYYTAKALWLHSLHSSDAQSQRHYLKEALEIAFDRLETVRVTQPRDIVVVAIYNLCIAFVLAMRDHSGFAGSFFYPDIRTKYENLPGKGDIYQHQQFCSDNALQYVNYFIQESSALGQANQTIPRFIYTESTERLDNLSLFLADAKKIKAFKDDPLGMAQRFTAGLDVSA